LQAIRQSAQPGGQSRVPQFVNVGRRGDFNLPLKVFDLFQQAVLHFGMH